MTGCIPKHRLKRTDALVTPNLELCGYMTWPPIDLYIVQFDRGAGHDISVMLSLLLLSFFFYIFHTVRIEKNKVLEVFFIS